MSDAAILDKDDTELDEDYKPDSRSDYVIKEAVRKRDGYRCFDCGRTREEHYQEYGRDLDVHRILPGCEYELAWCVTLCRACHGKRPKNLWDAITKQVDMHIFCLRNHDELHQRIVAGLKRIAASRSSRWHIVALEALADYVGVSTDDYCI